MIDAIDTEMKNKQNSNGSKSHKIGCMYIIASKKKGLFLKLKFSEIVILSNNMTMI